AVRHGDDRTHVACLGRALEILDTLLDQIADLGRLQSHGVILFCPRGVLHPESGCQFVEAVPDAAVDDPVTDLEPRTTDEFLIDIDRQPDLPSETLLKRLRDGGLLL